MKFSIILLCPIAILFFIYQEQVLGQSLYPYGGVPVPYDNYEDDDLGVILTILLLAARNRNGNCNCCNCCNLGGGAKTIPVPYPIPFPTNNPIINNRQSAQGDESYETEESKSEEVNFSENVSSNVTVNYRPDRV